MGHVDNNRRGRTPVKAHLFVKHRVRCEIALYIYIFIYIISLSSLNNHYIQFAKIQVGIKIE